MLWLSVSEPRTRVHDQGFLIVETDAEVDWVPLDCPVCELSLRDTDDVRAFYRVECCRDCELHFVQPNMGRWSDGWRPSEKEIISRRRDLRDHPSYLVK